MDNWSQIAQKLQECQELFFNKKGKEHQRVRNSVFFPL